MPQSGWTALTGPVPALDPLLASIEAAHPGATRPGVPAHVTFLYPFVSMTELDTATTDWLTALASRHAPLSLEFTEVRTEPGFVYLGSPLLTPLTLEIRAHWPHLVPYLGRFGQAPEAHLSLAIDVADPADLATIVEIASAALPKRARVEKLWLVGNDEGRWRPLGDFPLTGQ
jgi:hypothetical protein